MRAREVITIGKKVDWNVIKTEYIAGGISQRKLAKKYDIPFPTLRDRAKNEEWAKQRDKVRDRAVTKTIEKTADAVVSNAVKLERAKGLAIDRLIKALEQMPEKSGTHSRQTITEGGKRMTVDYDLIDIVVSLEKLTRENESKPDNAVNIIIDV